MLFLKHLPARPLSDFVEYLWLLSDAPAHPTERILPTGTLELVINLHDDVIRIDRGAGTWNRLSGCVVSGAYAKSFVFDTRAHALIMGAHFTPGGALLGSRASPRELGDVHVDGDSLWGSRARELRERLCSASSHARRFRILEDELLERALEVDARGANVDRAVRELSRGVSVREVVENAGMSHRRFVTAFRDAVGMTPKVFSRVQRFQRAIRAAERPVAVDWAELALACGYYDQAHLIRDFGAFAGSTPGEWLQRQSAALKEHHVAAQ
jgi:AraC-like DNA-binding protein